MSDISPIITTQSRRLIKDLLIIDDFEGFPKDGGFQQGFYTSGVNTSDKRAAVSQEIADQLLTKDVDVPALRQSLTARLSEPEKTYYQGLREMLTQPESRDDLKAALAKLNGDQQISAGAKQIIKDLLVIDDFASYEESAFVYRTDNPLSVSEKTSGQLLNPPVHVPNISKALEKQLSPVERDYYRQLRSRLDLPENKEDLKDALCHLYPADPAEVWCQKSSEEANKTRVDILVNGSVGALAATQRQAPNYGGLYTQGQFGVAITTENWYLYPNINYESFSNPIRFYGAFDFIPHALQWDGGGLTFSVGAGGIYGWQKDPLDTKVKPLNDINNPDNSVTEVTKITGGHEHITYSGVLLKAGLNPKVTLSGDGKWRLQMPLSLNGAISDLPSERNLTTLDFTPNVSLNLSNNFYLSFGPNVVYQPSRGNWAIGGAIGLGYNPIVSGPDKDK